MIIEPVVDIGLRQHRKKSRQHYAAQEIHGRDDDRERACISVDQQHHRIERVTCGLDGQHLAAADDTAFQHIGGQLTVARKRPVRTLAFKRWG